MMALTLKTLALLPLLALSAAAAAGAPTATPAAHDHAVRADKATTTSGQRWPPDAPLRAGMARVRVATDALAHLEHGHLAPAQVRALADELRSAVNAMFAQCRLAPAPDAALHPLLARILAASQALRDRPDAAAPVAELKDVLAQYRKQFEQARGPAVRH
jgi:hypothetical protein